MNNNTRDDYKNAIRAKYEIEKEGDFSNFFEPTSPANLRNLCWEKFISNEKADDLNIFSSVFGFEFNIERSKHFSTTTTDKFRPVMSFLKGEKEAAKFNRVELAAILVDFNPRPFKKFKEKGVVQIENIKGSIESINSPSLPQTFFTKELIKNGDSIEIKEDENKIEEESLLEEEILNQLRIPDVREEFISEENSKEDLNNFTFSEIDRETFWDRFFKRSKKVALATIVIFSLIGLVVYFAFFKNHCMQWTEDHFEIVDCSSNYNGNQNEIIPIDKDLLDFRKIKACDTTKCFLSNGEAFVWYGKTATGIDFFNDNGNGKHPVTKRALRPVSTYIFDKYLRNKSCN